MATILKFVDETGATRLDLNSTSGFVLGRGLDVGSPDLDQAWFRSVEGALPYGETVGSAMMRIPIRMTTQASAAAMKTLIDSLNTELNRETNIIEYRPNGLASSYFLDTFRAPLTSLRRGDDAPDPFTMLQDAREITLLIPREPYARQASTNLLNASSMTAVVDSFEAKVNNPGTMPSPTKLTVAVAAAAAEGVQLRAVAKNFTSEAIADEFATLYSREAEDGTLGTNTASSADANASGGDFARTTYAATGYSRERVEVVFTPGSANAKKALEGEYDVYAVVRLTEGSEQTLQLRSGLRSSDPLDNVHEPVTLDATDANAAMWVPVKLGRVEYTTNTEKLVLQLWAQLDVQPGSAVLDTDYFYLQPVGSKVVTAGTMGWRAGKAASERFNGDELVTPTDPGSLTAGTINENGLVLDADTEAGGLQPNAGTTYPAGRLVVTARVTVKDQSGDKTELGVLRLRNITDGTTVASRKIYSKKNRKEWEHEIEIAYTTDAAKAYQAQVAFTKASPDPGQKIIVNEIKTRMIRVVGNGDSFVVDAVDPENDGLWSSSLKVAHLPVSTHLTLEPGWNTVLVQMAEWSGLVYQQDVDEREPLAKIVQTRAYTVTLDVTPMHPA